eukprot:CAMPEP_0183433388 /NCGR_PEP_ID=MMETSP0370-20130417/61361_1 /TAXON_ID=268820 /ORGANISM="Peridinium aciculiferum, Strain PAER-2" /LENGTH=77 /DNA_ID=CAMNT_0025619717 /DNA_START=76 /DNA_END=306 /DNA_ORIENTATION=-
MRKERLTLCTSAAYASHCTNGPPNQFLIEVLAAWKLGQGLSENTQALPQAHKQGMQDPLDGSKGHPHPILADELYRP